MSVPKTTTYVSIKRVVSFIRTCGLVILSNLMFHDDGSPTLNLRICDSEEDGSQQKKKKMNKIYLNHGKDLLLR